MEWAYPWRWIWALAIGVFAGLWLVGQAARRRTLSQLADPRLWPELAASVDESRRRVKAWLIGSALSLSVAALAGPQWGFQWQEVTHRGVDLVIALDVSKSMLAEDIKPNRLERAKLGIKELVPLLDGDRIGLAVFAGSAFLQCPLTVDYDAFMMSLDDVTVESIPRGGTALTEAMRVGREALAKSATGSKALLLITDGEDTTGDPLAAANQAKEDGIVIFCVGVGTPSGELIPMTDEQGHRTFVKDEAGRTVQSRLDEATLQRLATMTGGSYVRATPTSFGVETLYRERIKRLAEVEHETAWRKQQELRYQWPLAAAWLLLFLEPLLSDRRRRPA